MSFTYLRADNRWPGLTRVAPYLLLTIAINSIALLAISCFVPSPISRSLQEQFTSCIFTIAPHVLNICCSSVSICLHKRNKASPSRMLTLSATFLLGWFFDFSLHTVCDAEGDSGIRYCSSIANPTRSRLGLQIVKNVLGLLCALAWASLVSLSVAAAYRSKIDENLRKLNERDEESSERLFDQKEILLDLENEQ